MIVLDASVLIAHLDSSDAHHDRAQRELMNASDERLGASTITIAEILVEPARAGRLDEAQRTLDELGVHELRLPDGAARKLGALRAQTGLRLPDCCVLLAALDTQAALLTFDDRLKAEAKRLKLA